MMKTTSASEEVIRDAGTDSGHLEHDALDDVDHVLAAVGDRLHRLVQLLPLDHLDGVLAPFEERRELITKEAISFVLEAIHLDRVLVIEGRKRAEAAYRAVSLLRRLHDDLGHCDAPVRRCV